MPIKLSLLCRPIRPTQSYVPSSPWNTSHHIYEVGRLIILGIRRNGRLLLFVPRQVQGHARSASPPCSDLSASDIGALEIETNMADVDTCLIEIFNPSAPLLKYSMYLFHWFSHFIKIKVIFHS